MEHVTPFSSKLSSGNVGVGGKQFSVKQQLVFLFILPLGMVTLPGVLHWLVGPHALENSSLTLASSTVVRVYAETHTCPAGQTTLAPSQYVEYAFIQTLQERAWPVAVRAERTHSRFSIAEPIVIGRRVGRHVMGSLPWLIFIKECVQQRGAQP